MSLDRKELWSRSRSSFEIHSATTPWCKSSPSQQRRAEFWCSTYSFIGHGVLDVHSDARISGEAVVAAALVLSTATLNITTTHNLHHRAIRCLEKIVTQSSSTLITGSSCNRVHDLCFCSAILIDKDWRAYYSTNTPVKPSKLKFGPNIIINESVMCANFGDPRSRDRKLEHKKKKKKKATVWSKIY